MRGFQFIFVILPTFLWFPVPAFSQIQLCDMECARRLLTIDPGSYDPSAAMEPGPVFGSGLKIVPPPLPQPDAPAPVGYDSVRQELFVNGTRFHRDDYNSAVASIPALRHPRVVMPQNFRPLSPEDFKRYIAKAKNHLENPVSAFFGDIKESIEESIASARRKDAQFTDRIKANVRRCYDIADNRYPLDPDWMLSDARRCVDDLYGPTR